MSNLFISLLSRKEKSTIHRAFISYSKDQD